MEYLTEDFHRPQILSDTVSTFPVIAENDGRFITQTAQQTIEGLQLVLCRRIHLIQMQAFLRLLLPVQEIQSDRPVQARKLRNLFCVRSRQQKPPFQSREFGNHLLHFLLESQFQTFVELVDYQQADLSSFNILLSQMVIHSSRRTDDYRRIERLHRTMFLHSRTSSVTTHHPESGSHGFEYLLYLQGKLPRRCQYHRLHSLHFRIEGTHQRQQVGKGLSRPRRRKQNHVSSLFEQREGLALHLVQLIYFEVIQYLLYVHIDNCFFN